MSAVIEPITALTPATVVGAADTFPFVQGFTLGLSSGSVMRASPPQIVAAGIPPISGNMVGTLGANLVMLFDGTEIHFCTPANLGASGTATSPTPSVTTTSAVYGTDLITVYRNGTAAVASLKMEFAAYAAYAAANQPSITLTSPGTVTHGVAFTVAGTLANYGTTPTLELSTDGGAFGSLPAGSSYNMSTLDLVITSLAVGSHTLQLEDQNGVKSNAISVTAI